MSHVRECLGVYKDEKILESTLCSLVHPIYGPLIRKNKNTYKWYGKHVGDYPLPSGFTVEDLGKCDFAFGFEDNTLYEIGVVKRGEEYIPLFDFWSIDGSGQGGPLQETIGEAGSILCQTYNANVILSTSEELGHNAVSWRDIEGNIIVEVEVEE